MGLLNHSVINGAIIDEGVKVMLRRLNDALPTEAESAVLASVTAGTRAASKAVVLDSNSAINQWDVAQTITSATPSTTRLTRSEVTLTPTSTMTVQSGGSIAGVRGGVTVSAGKTFVDGFLYGAQGKVTLNGTFNQDAAGRLAGAIGQVDLASGTVTDGQVSGVWADLQSTAPTLTSHAEINALRVTNSMASQAKCNAMVFTHGMSDFWADINEPAASVIATPAGAVASGDLRTIKIAIGGATYYVLAAGGYGS